MRGLKNVFLCLCLLAALIGAFGGLGYALYIHEYVVAVSIVVLAVFAAPTWVQVFNYLKQ